MDEAAEQLDFERAAMLRDQIAALTDVQARQVVTRARAGADTDVIAVAEEGGDFCVALMFVRGGAISARSTFFPRAPISDAPEVLAAFVAQYYLARDAPPEIYCRTPIEDAEMLEASLSERSGRQGADQRGASAAIRSAGSRSRAERANALRMREATAASLADQFEELRAIPGLAQPLAAHRVLRREPHDGRGDRRVLRRLRPGRARSRRNTGVSTSRIRRPATTTARSGRRCCAAIARVKAEESPLPDLLLIDGGTGQLEQAIERRSRNSSSTVPAVAGVAKGADRRPGRSAFLGGPWSAPLYCRRTRRRCT